MRRIVDSTNTCIFQSIMLSFSTQYKEILQRRKSVIIVEVRQKHKIIVWLDVHYGAYL